MAHPKQYFQLVDTPDVHQTIEDIDVYIYFLDRYEFRHQALKQQLFFMQAKPSSISLLLEQEIYELISEYYSAQSLRIVHQYFMELYKKKFFIAFTGGFVITVLVGWLVDVLQLQLPFAGWYGLAVGTMSMLVILSFTLRRQQRRARDTMRERLIALHGENRLNAYLERQEKYMQERRLALDSSGE
jgi:hypothetical protein